MPDARPLPRRWALAVVVPVLAAGCDPIYGVQARGTFPANLDVACVTRTLAGDPAFADARHLEGLPGLALGNLAWGYGEDNHSVLQLTRQRDEWEFSNARLQMGTRPPEAEIERFVPVMTRVDAELAANCGLRIESQTRS